MAGACDIIAETISDDADTRSLLREQMARHGFLTARAAGEEDSVYRTYYDFAQPLSRVQATRSWPSTGEKRRGSSR